MGLLVPVARIILKEHRYRSLTGRLLCIGRQTVPMTPARALRVLREEGVPANPGSAANVDDVTRHAAGKGFILDSSFFSLFSTARFSAMDVSPYEGADIIWDLNAPIPGELEGQFDFIYNGSCLDNIFDPASSMRNFSRLLKPGGRIVHLEHGTHVNGPYLMYPPEWFYDYYAINGFADCKAYIADFSRVYGSFRVRSWNPLPEHGSHSPAAWRFNRPRRDYFVIIIAEKGETSTWEKSPLQSQYRSAAQHEEYLRRAAQFNASARPSFTPLAPSWRVHLSASILRLPQERLLRLVALYRRLPQRLQRLLDPGEQCGRSFTLRN